jgi:solute:Na+ symporter, SSS family
MNLEGYSLIWLSLYLIFLIVIVKIARKYSGKLSILKKTQDFYLSTTKPLGVPVLIFTFAATLFSAFFMIGIPGFLLTHGLVTWPYVIFGDVLGMLGLFFVGKKIIERRTGFGNEITPLDLFLPTKLAKILFLLGTSIFILPYLSVQISGFGKLIESATSGNISFFLASSIGLIIIYLYSLLAGIRGVAFSDLFQGILLLVCSIVVGYYMTFEMFDGPADLFSRIQKSHPDLLLSPGPKNVFSYGLLISGCILFASIPITQPQFLTRYLLIKNKEPIKYLRHISIGMGLIIAIGALAVLPVGLGGAIIYPNLKSGDLLMGTFLADHLPNWFGGLFTVGVLAAAMSTADSILFSLGQIFSHDVYKNMININTSEEGELLAGKSFIFILAFIALLLGTGNSRLIVSLSSLSFAGTLQLLPAIIGGLWFKNAWQHSSTISIIIGIGMMFFFQSYNPFAFIDLNPAIPALLVGSLSYVLTMKRPNEEASKI